MKTWPLTGVNPMTTESLTEWLRGEAERIGDTACYGCTNDPDQIGCYLWLHAAADYVEGLAAND